MKTNNSRYTLRCMAPDGATVTEGHFPTIDTAWQRASDMGSCWFFFPINIVTGSTFYLKRARIVAVPDGMSREWIGKTFGKLSAACESDSQSTADYCNGLIPFPFYP